MFRHSRLLSPLILSAVVGGISPSCAADAMLADAAWKALPKYEYGQDLAALLTIEGEVIKAMGAPATRAACAARLAALLEVPGTTPAAKQYICLQLRQIGTPADVPALAKLLAKPETSQMARYALESIPGEASLAELRDALDTLQGDVLIGAINSVGARKDVRALAKLQALADGKDQRIAATALWALGNIGGPAATTFLQTRAEKVGAPTPQELAVPLLRCADALAAGGAEQAQAIYGRLSAAGQAVGTRRAALEGILRHQKEQASATVLSWLGDADADRRLVATGRLALLSDDQLGRLFAGAAELPDASRLMLLDILASRQGKKALPLMVSAARNDKPAIRLAGLRALGQIGDASAIPVLVAALGAGHDVAAAAQQSLCSLPRQAVCEALLVALKEQPGVRGPAIEVLKRLKCCEAIDPLIGLAATANPDSYGPALDGLRGIADPNDYDVPRLVKLLLATPPGKHREEVERTILIVCEKLPVAADRATPVLAALAKVDSSELPQYLPLLGRLGGAKVLEIVNAALGSDNPEVKQAAVRALCNWPSAEVADRLWKLAGRPDDKVSQQWALRAYVRVVTLKSDRPPAQTLAMLQKVMKLAGNVEDKQWVLSRASTVRTLEAVSWIAQYLDDPNLGQTACQAIVELAHHRFLRHPNMDRFGPLLEKVSQISNDPGVVERAKKYRLGL